MRVLDGYCADFTIAPPAAVQDHPNTMALWAEPCGSGGVVKGLSSQAVSSRWVKELLTQQRHQVSQAPAEG